MVIRSLIIWWYTEGLKRRFLESYERITSLIDYFSIDQMGLTLFSPFHQISAGSVSGPIGSMLQAFFDRLVSRCVGFVVRLVLIITGSLAVFVSFLYAIMLVMVWVVLPILPVLGVIAFLIGWSPWNR